MARQIRKTLEEKRISRVAFELGIPEDMVKNTVNLLFKYIKNKVEGPVLKGESNLSEEEFNKLVPIVKIPALGMLTPSYAKYQYIKRAELNKLARTNKEENNE